MNDIVIYLVDDWAVLYVNGKEMDQGHTIELDELAQYCPIASIKTIWANTNLEEFVTETGSFPDTLEETQALHNQK